MKELIIGALTTALTIATSGAHADTAILIFGGKDHDVFLGCLNCSTYSQDAICNKYGTYGSKYNSDSIWNQYGRFGSKYNDESPWGKYANDVPVLVDGSGNFYGYMTANRYHDKRTTMQGVVALTDYVAEEDDLDKARDAWCDN